MESVHWMMEVRKKERNWCHIPFYSFICSFVFDCLLDSMMPQHLFCVPYSITNDLHHSVLPSFHPLLILHPPSLPHYHLPFSIPLTTCSIFHLPTPCPFVLFLSLSFQHLFITPCLPMLTLTIENVVWITNSGQRLNILRLQQILRLNCT